MTRVSNETSEKVGAWHHFSLAKTVNPLISIIKFCVKKQQLQPLKLNQTKLNSKITNCILRVSKKASNYYII